MKREKKEKKTSQEIRNIMRSRSSQKIHNIQAKKDEIMGFCGRRREMRNLRKISHGQGCEL